MGRSDCGLYLVVAYPQYQAIRLFLCIGEWRRRVKFIRLHPLSRRIEGQVGGKLPVSEIVEMRKKR